MKVAIIDQHNSAGGGSRFLKALALSLSKKYPNLKIGLFVDVTALERDSLFSFFRKNFNIEIIPLKQINKSNTTSKNSIKKNKIICYFKKSAMISKLYNFLILRILGKGCDWCKFKLSKETINQLNKYDVIYLAWPYFIEPVKFDTPVVGTFHDFNFKYNFGNFNDVVLKILNRQVSQWLKICDIAVVSTQFIRSELKKFFPKLVKIKKIIYLAPFNVTQLSPKDSLKAIEKSNLPKNYIICPSNISYHKNLKNLFEAFIRAKNKGLNLSLVLIGSGTDKIKFFKEHDFPSHDPLFFLNKLRDALEKSNIKFNKDIWPLGYVSDKDADALIAGAKLVVSTSLYEAGSGPALDAWNAGVPVAFSNIPPFLEQLEFLDTKAWVFDPKNPSNIAEIMRQALEQKEKSKEMTEESKKAIDKYTWDNVAESYYKTFQEAINIKEQ